MRTLRAVRSTRWLRLALLGCVVALGVTLRLLGLRLGLPYGHHWDEGWIVDSVSHMLVTQSDVPETFQYGTPLMFLGVDVYDVFTRFVRDVSPTNATALRWMVRGVSVAVSASGIIGVYLASRWGDRNAVRGARAGLFAALLYAGASELVTHARYAVTDACLVALTAWTLALTARFLRSQHLAWGAAALLAAGVAFAFKITALPTAAIPIAALALVPGRLPPIRSAVPQRALLLGAVPVVLGTFLAFNHSFIDRDHSQEAMHDIVVRTLQTHDGGFPEYSLRQPGLIHLAAAVGGVARYALHRTPAISITLALLGVLGLAVTIRRRNLLFAIAAGHALLAVVLIAWPNRAFLLRNYLVAVPALCLGFGVVAGDVAERLRRRGWLLAAPVAVIALVALVVMPLRDALACQALSVDPRQRATEWIAARSGPGTRLALTPSVMGDAAVGRYGGFDRTLRRDDFTYTEVRTCDEVLASGADYVVNVPYRPDLDIVAFDERWFFERCPSYEEVARFEPNPYEHNFAVTPTWDGRVTAVVLARVQR